MIKTLLIITLCVVGVAPAYGNSEDYIRAASNVMRLSKACEAFRDEYKEYPPEGTWLTELQATGKADITHDVWGNGFVYRFPGRHNPGSFDLYSLGEDGKTETDGDDPDDISNWHEPERWRKHYNPPAITTLQTVFIAGIVISIFILMRSLRRKHQS